ncbi:hypothetical protein [Paenibacillus chitinolyticus]|uniref:hypothetical protein n=1 Tax=Paenibacillus chitinolyticus TaxID=79263 RepID=UPI00366D5C1F
MHEKAAVNHTAAFFSSRRGYLLAAAGARRAGLSGSPPPTLGRLPGPYAVKNRRYG